MKRPDRWKTPLPWSTPLLTQREMVARIEAARIAQPMVQRCPHCRGPLDVEVRPGRAS